MVLGYVQDEEFFLPAKIPSCFDSDKILSFGEKSRKNLDLGAPE